MKANLLLFLLFLYNRFCWCTLKGLSIGVNAQASELLNPPYFDKASITIWEWLLSKCDHGCKSWRTMCQQDTDQAQLCDRFPEQLYYLYWLKFVSGDRIPTMSQRCWSSLHNTQCAMRGISVLLRLCGGKTFPVRLIMRWWPIRLVPWLRNVIN